MKRNILAKVIDEKELIQIAHPNPNEAVENPILRHLVFLDCKATKDDQRRIFPCYLDEVVVYNDEVIMVYLSIVQWKNGAHELVRVRLMGEKILGITKDQAKAKFQIWSLPPAKNLMSMYPFPDEDEEEAETAPRTGAETGVETKEAAEDGTDV